jgi:hypothetical protein
MIHPFSFAALVALRVVTIVPLSARADGEATSGDIASSGPTPPRVRRTAASLPTWSASTGGSGSALRIRFPTSWPSSLEGLVLLWMVAGSPGWQVRGTAGGGVDAQAGGAGRRNSIRSSSAVHQSDNAWSSPIP